MPPTPARSRDHEGRLLCAVYSLLIGLGLAYVIALYVGALWIWRRGQGGWLPRIALLVLLQVALGISTLVLSVPLSLALGHQALAFMLAGAVMAWLADITPRRT